MAGVAVSAHTGILASFSRQTLAGIHEKFGAYARRWGLVQLVRKATYQLACSMQHTPPRFTSCYSWEGKGMDAVIWIMH